MRCQYPLLYALMLLPLYAVADPAISPEKAALRPLLPAQIQQIQGVSHAVLAAQVSQTPDQRQEALRQELSALQQEVDQLLSQPTVAASELKLSNAQPAIPDNASEQNPQRHFDKSRLAKVQNRLASVRQHRQNLEAHVQEHAGEERAEKLRALPGAVSNLEDDLTEVLNAPDGLDPDKLAALRDRLQTKTYAELHEEQERHARENGEFIPEPTPTISTITHHR